MRGRVAAALLVLCSLLVTRSTPTAANDADADRSANHGMHNMHGMHGMHGTHGMYGMHGTPPAEDGAHTGMDHAGHMDHASMMMQAFEYDEHCSDRCYEEFKKALPTLPPNPEPGATGTAGATGATGAAGTAGTTGAPSAADRFQLLIQRWCKDANVPAFKLDLSKVRAGKNCQKDGLVEQKDGPAVVLWATLPYSSFQLRRASVLLDSCITGSLGLQSSCWPMGPIRTNLAARDLTAPARDLAARDLAAGAASGLRDERR